MYRQIYSNALQEALRCIFKCIAGGTALLHRTSLVSCSICDSGTDRSWLSGSLAEMLKNSWAHNIMYCIFIIWFIWTLTVMCHRPIHCKQEQEYNISNINNKIIINMQVKFNVRSQPFVSRSAPLKSRGGRAPRCSVWQERTAHQAGVRSQKRDNTDKILLRDEHVKSRKEQEPHMLLPTRPPQTSHNTAT
jgi:hypothetical protein